MTQTLHPGVYVIEEPAAPAITGVGITTAGFVGLAAKGTTDTLRLITSFQQFKEEFGDYFKLGGSYVYLAFAVNAFFNEGGSACYVVRVAPNDAVKSSGSLLELDQTAQAANLEALSVGDWGNKLAIQVEKRAPMVVQTAVTDEASDTIAVDNIVGLETGDLVYVKPASGGDALDDNLKVVYGIDTSGTNPVIELDSALAFTPSPITNGLPVNSTVHVSSRHRFRSKLVNDVSIGSAPTSIDVTSGTGANLVPGQLIVLVGDDGLSPVAKGVVYGVVDSVIEAANYDRINFKSGSGKEGSAATIQANGNETVCSVEFDVNIFENNILKESHERVSMSRDNARDFVGGSTTGASPLTAFLDGRLYGTTNESNRVQITSWGNSTATTVAKDVIEAIPLTDSKTQLSSGADGTNSTAQIPDSKFTAAVDLYKDSEDVSMLACPDAAGNTVVQKKLADHATLMRTLVALIDPDLSDSEGTTAITEITNWRNNVLNVDDSYSALYWPWLVVPDPAQSSLATPDPGAFSQGFGSASVKIPPSGHMAGVYASVVFNRGVHKAPANEVLSGVLDVTRRITDADHDFLNPIGINAIRFFPGQGIRPWGARTLFSNKNGKHYVNVRRLLIFIERSLKEGNRFAVFEPNDPALYQVLRQVNTRFLRSLWEQGMLFPSNDINKAFFVKVDEETTTAADRKNGRVNILIGVNPPFPAEFVVFRVSLFDGQTSLETVVTGTTASGAVIL